MTDITSHRITSAKHIIEGVLHGTLRDESEGIVGLFLFRHYLELEMKYLIFHARWLKDWDKNAADHEIEDVMKDHHLKQLWAMVKKECEKRIPKDSWKAFDTQFVEKCIEEFEAIDPYGETFRYGSDRIGVQSGGINKPALGFDFKALQMVISHVHELFEMINVYLIERHRENEEWEAILKSY